MSRASLGPVLYPTRPDDCSCYPTLAPYSPQSFDDAHKASVYLNGYGALAEYTKVSAAHAAIRPKNVTPTEASGFLVAGLTAYQALFHIAKLEEGQSVFINGGSTSVGSFAIQLAKAKGARVAVSASGKNEQYVRGLGADEVRRSLPRWPRALPLVVGS